MKILVLKGSPHKEGSSSYLADCFIKGAIDKGHETKIIDVAHSNIKPCMGCNVCRTGGECCQNDDMKNSIVNEILNADMLVFVSPVYYFGISAQLKLLIDRFYSINAKITAKNMKSALIVAACDTEEYVTTSIESHYKTICGYLNFEDRGTILGLGCGTPAMTQETTYPYKAFMLGKNL